MTSRHPQSRRSSLPPAPQHTAARADALRVPEESAAEWGIAGILFLCSALFLWPFRDYTIFNADEGIVLQGATRVLRGEVPYRDFFSFYTPGSYYWYALVFKILGNTLVAGRTVLVLYGAVFSVLVYMLARRVCARWPAILATYLLLVICLPYRFLVLHNWDSTVWALLALYCAVRLLQTPHWRWAFGMGSAAGLATLFEQSKGAGIVIGVALGFLLVRARGRQGFLSKTQLAAAAAGFAWPFIITAIYFGSQGSLSGMLQAWLWPIRHYTEVNRLPYGHLTLSSDALEEFYADPSWTRRFLFLFVLSPCLILPALPVLALGLLAIHTWKVRNEEAAGTASTYCVIVWAASCGLTFSTMLSGRPDFTHLLYISPPLLVILGWLVGGCGLRSSLLDSTRPLIVVYLLLSFTAFGLTLLLPALNARVQLETRRGLLRTREPDLVLPYVQEHVAPGEHILVFPYQPLYYYLTGMSSPVRFDFLQYGMHTAEQLDETQRSLAEEPPLVVLFDLSFKGEKIPQAWPSTPPQALSRDPVQDFIFSQYRPCRALPSQAWRFVFMVRKDTTCPG